MQSTFDTRLTVSAPTPHTEAWINCKELAEANAQVQSLMVPASSDPTHLKKSVQKWLQRELGFIGNPQFSAPRAGREIFAEELGLTPKCSESGTAEVPNGGVNLPLAAARLCEAPLLTRKQEP